MESFYNYRSGLEFRWCPASKPIPAQHTLPLYALPDPTPEVTCRACEETFPAFQLRTAPADHEEPCDTICPVCGAWECCEVPPKRPPSRIPAAFTFDTCSAGAFTNEIIVPRDMKLVELVASLDRGSTAAVSIQLVSNGMVGVILGPDNPIVLHPGALETSRHSFRLPYVRTGDRLSAVIVDMGIYNFSSQGVIIQAIFEEAV